MSKHTPGPWAGITGQTAQFGSIHTEDTRIATVEPDFTEETKANIRLIAAAPDLLALALRVVETATICRDCEWDVQKHELIQLLTRLEQEAKEAITQATAGGAK